MPTTASAASPDCRPSRRSARRTTASSCTTPAATSCFCRSRTSSCCRATAPTTATAQLDRLGGVAWQSRKARLKKRLREIASELIKIAALRQLKEAPAMAPPHGAYDEFVARFPYEETEDQAAEHRSGARRSRRRQADGPARLRRRRLRQNGSGAPRRVRCGDRPASRSLSWCRRRCSRASISRLSAERFQGLPVRIAQASRLVGAKELADVKRGLKSGQIDIVVGTHALLGKID